MFLLAGAVPAGPQTPQDVTVRASLDRTAMFVGDRVTYTVDISCKPGVDILADDLSRDKLKVEGLEVIDARTDRSSSDRDGSGRASTIYRFRYTLTSYRIDAASLTIAPLTVRYAVTRAGQRLEDAAPAGEVQVPGATVAFRSVLPDDHDEAGIRSGKPPHARPMRLAALQSIGIGLVIVAIVPALFAIATLVRRRASPRVRRSARVVRQAERVSLDAVRAMQVDTTDGRRAALTELDALVREHLRDVCGVPGPSLTPSEVPAALATSGAKLPADLVVSVLATCELARYAPPHAMPSPAACRDAIENAAGIVNA